MSSRYNGDNIEVEFKKFLSAGNSSRTRLTINNYLSDFRHYLGWHINNHSVSDSANETGPHNWKNLFVDWNSNFTSQYVEYLKDQQTPSSTINRRLSTLRVFLSFLRETQIIPPTEPNNARTLANPILAPSTIKKTSNQKIEQHFILLQWLNHNIINDRNRLNAVLSTTVSFSLFLTLSLLSGYFTLNPSTSRLSQGSIQGQLSRRDVSALSFEGRLLDSVGNPITAKTPVRFKIYSSNSNKTAIYDTKTCYVSPDKNGNVAVPIGGASGGMLCGTPIPRDFFTQYAKLYLGVTVGQDKELKPRQQIENVQLAGNSKKLNNLARGTAPNSIPYIDPDGKIKLSSDTTSIEATSTDAQFSITSNESLSLIAGHEGDVKLVSGANGGINFQTGATPIDRLVISSTGNVGIATANPIFTLDVGGTIGPSIGNVYDLGSYNKPWSTLYVRDICFVNSTCIDSTSSSSADLWKRENNALSSTHPSNDLIIGGTATSSANVKISGTSGSHTFIRSGYLGINTSAPVSALHVVGTGTFSSNALDITTRENEDLTLNADGTGLIKLNDTTQVGYSFASGTSTTDATSTLDISGTGTAYALCHSSQDGTDDQQIVDCVSSPTADFAEMYPVEQNSEVGDVMSLGPTLTKTVQGDNIRTLIRTNKSFDNHVIGIISSNDEDFISVGHNIKKEDNPMPIALKGRVPVKIAYSSDDIEAGDYITTSAQEGRAMKATRPGVVIGKALENWSPSMGKTSIMVFVNIEYADPYNFLENSISYINQTLDQMQKRLEVKEKIVSPIIEADIVKAMNIQTDVLYPQQKNLTIDLTNSLESSNSGELAKIIVKGLEGKTATTIDAEGNIITRGNIEAKSASISGELVADALNSNNLNTQEATIAGTLNVQNIESKTINELKNNITSAIQKYSVTDKNIEDIRSTIDSIKNTPLPNPSWYQNLSQEEISSDQTLLTNLIVTGDANLFNAHIHERIYTLQDKLKIDAGSTISFFNDSVTIARDGTLTAQNKIVAKGGIHTNSITPLEGNLEVKLNENTPQSAFQIKNSRQENVASIDASGSALFKRINISAHQLDASSSAIIAKEQNLVDHGIDLYGIQTDSESAGIAILPANETEVVIYNSSLTQESLFFLTPIDSTQTPLYIATKHICDQNLPVEESEKCLSYVKVATAQQEHDLIRFNWLILNNQ